jgi:hypothetical protein
VAHGLAVCADGAHLPGAEARILQQLRHDPAYRRINALAAKRPAMDLVGTRCCSAPARCAQLWIEGPMCVGAARKD